MGFKLNLNVLDMKKFSGWHAVPVGTYQFGPAITAAGPGGRDLWAVGMDSRLWGSSYRTETSWEAPINLGGGKCTSSPAAVAYGGATFVVVLQSGTVALWYGQGPSVAPAWLTIPDSTPFIGDPGIAIANNEIYVFAMKKGGWLNWTKNELSSFSNAKWTPWAEISTGEFSSGPAAAGAFVDGKLTVVARGLNNYYYSSSVYSAANLGGSQSPWHQMPAAIYAGGPAVVLWAKPWVELTFGLGEDKHIWTAEKFSIEAQTEADFYLGARSIPGDRTFVSRPAVSSGGDGQLDVVALDAATSVIYINSYQA
jgi:hypothetical protein